MVHIALGPEVTKLLGQGKGRGKWVVYGEIFIAGKMKINPRCFGF